MKPIFHRVEQQSEEWHALRRTGIGASDIATITGDSPWGDVLTLYQEKRGLAARSVASPAMSVGQRLEDAVRRWYAEDSGQKVRQVHGIYRHPEIPFVIASLDGITARAPRSVVQIKVADSLGDGWGEEGTDQIPDHYREQIEWEMLASGIPRATLVVFVVRARRLAVFHAEQDQRLTTALLSYARPFWECVQTGQPPDPPSARDIPATLKADEITATPEIVELVDTHRFAAESARDADERLTKAKDALRAALADVGGTRGALPDGRKFAVHYRPTKAGTEVRWELLWNEVRQRLRDHGFDDDSLDVLLADYTVPTASTRPLRVTIQKGAS